MGPNVLIYWYQAFSGHLKNVLKDGRKGLILKIEAKLAKMKNRLQATFLNFHFDLFRFCTLTLIKPRKSVSFSLT